MRRRPGFCVRSVAERIGFVTTNYAINEAVASLRYDAGLAAALDFRERILALQTIGRAPIVWIDEPTEDDGWRVLEQYADLSLSLTDTISAVVARSSRLTDVFGFDAHLAALGFTVVPYADDR